MKIKVLLNGVLHSEFGWRERELELPAETTVGGLKRQLEEYSENFTFSAIAANTALNQKVVSDDETTLHDGDVVSFLPPLAGG